jgi:hypothetical protein
VSVVALLGNADVPEDVLLSQWRNVFKRGFRICPTTAFFTSLLSFSNAFLTYWFDSPSASSESIGGGHKVLRLIIAGIFFIGLVPFTLTFIEPTNDYLMEKETKLSKRRELAKETLKASAHGRVDMPANEGSIAETRMMIKRWANFNYCRTTLPFIGALISWTML